MHGSRKRPESETLTRRGFVLRSAAGLGAACLGGCRGGGQGEGPGGEGSSDQERRPAPALAPGVDRETVLDLVETTAHRHMGVCFHCAQSSFLALQESFGLEGDEIVKALTPLPGIAERGETCGAVTGSLLAMGLVFGRDRLTDFGGWRRSLEPARRFCDRFVGAFGSTQCGDIVERECGRRYDLYDPEEQQAYVAAGGSERCSRVVGVAARYAADEMLGPLLSFGGKRK